MILQIAGILCATVTLLCFLILAVIFGDNIEHRLGGVIMVALQSVIIVALVSTCQ